MIQVLSHLDPGIKHTSPGFRKKAGVFLACAERAGQVPWDY